MKYLNEHYPTLYYCSSQIDDLRKSSSVPTHIQIKFNTSYKILEEHLDWFKKYHSKIREWANNTVHELGLDLDLTLPVGNSTDSQGNSTDPQGNSTESLGNSSSVSLNGHAFVFIFSTLVVNILLLNI